MRRRRAEEMERIMDGYEDRLFEDPLYLMQYTIAWEDTKVSGQVQSPENEAFINAENEIYLRKVYQDFLFYLIEHFYRAMLRRARYCRDKLSVCLYVRPSVCL